MSALDRLDPPTRAALAEHVSRLKHDLGKYVAFQVRWVAPDASLADRRAALAADLLATRRGPEGELDAVSLWRDVRRPLVGASPLDNGATVDLSADPAVRAIDASIAVVDAVVPALKDGTATDDDVRKGTDAALAIAEACRDLHKRTR